MRDKSFYSPFNSTNAADPGQFPVVGEFGATGGIDLNNVAWQQQGGLCRGNDGETFSHSTRDPEARKASPPHRDLGRTVAQHLGHRLHDAIAWAQSSMSCSRRGKFLLNLDGVRSSSIFDCAISASTRRRSACADATRRSSCRATSLGDLHVHVRQLELRYTSMRGDRLQFVQLGQSSWPTSVLS